MSYLTISEAARYLGVHEQTLRAWERRGYVRAYRPRGGWRRFDSRELRRVSRGE
ncbi:MAG: excisionase family DNA-binding protein [Dehalococcoidia bacterium]